MRKPAALLIAVLMLFAVAACGSSDDSSSATSTTAKSSVAVTTSSKDDTGSSTTGPETSASETDSTADTSVPKRGSGSEEAYTKALAKSLAAVGEGNLAVPVKGAECVAPKWIDAIGVDTLEKKGVNPSDLAEGFAFTDLDLSKAQATTMVKAFGDCRVDIYSQLLKTFSIGLSGTQSACLRTELTRDKAMKFLVGLLAGGNDDEFVAQGGALDKKCKLSEDGTATSTPDASTGN